MGCGVLVGNIAVKPTEVSILTQYNTRIYIESGSKNTYYLSTMAIPKSKKEAVVEQLKDIFTNAQTVVFVQFDKVTAEEANTLRDICANEEVGYLVAKKTLIRKAFTDSSIEGALPEMEGEIALAYGNDMLAPARVMGEQGKTLKERLTIVGGVFENALVSQEEMQAIAAIPPLKTLYAQFLTIIQAPVQGLASALSQIADKKEVN